MRSLKYSLVSIFLFLLAFNSKAAVIDLDLTGQTSASTSGLLGVSLGGNDTVNILLPDNALEVVFGYSSLVGVNLGSSVDIYDYNIQSAPIYNETFPLITIAAEYMYSYATNSDTELSVVFDSGSLALSLFSGFEAQVTKFAPDSPSAVSAVPEPSALLTMLLGMSVLGFIAYRKQKLSFHKFS